MSWAGWLQRWRGAGRRNRIYEERQRDLIHELLKIVETTERRDIAENELRRAKELLDDLADHGLETMEDRVSRHTLCALLRDLDKRFPGETKNSL